nr:hypothetical protein [Tanacetum cinerariifolium]
MTQRSSNRNKKVPIKFNDMIHDLTTNGSKSKNKLDEDMVKPIEKNMESGEIGADTECCNDGVRTEEAMEEVRDSGHVDTKSPGTSSSDRLIDSQKKIQPSIAETKDWNYDMINYFKNAWEAMEIGDNDSDEEDVEMIYDESVQAVIADVIDGRGSVPTSVNEKGDDVVIFYEDLVNEGSEKWKFTVCGYFVGSSMPVYEVKYNIRRMWGKHGLRDIVVDNDEICFAKFKDEEAWSKKGISTISRRLGRPIMMDKMTVDMCNKGKVRLCKDHSPGLLIFPEGLPKKVKSFGFTNYIADKKELLDAVAKGWDVEIKGSRRLKESLQVAQEDLDKDPFNVDKKKKAISILEEYTEHKNRVESICDENGTRFWGDEVATQIEKHFHNFLGVSYQVLPLEQLGITAELKLNTKDAEAMIVDVSDKEIKEAMFDIDSSKASGPNGYTSCFFKKAWSLIGKDVCMAIRDFFVKGKLLKEVNATLVALVPKVETPNKISDFRPIACCNVLYKCINKILTNRMKKGLVKLKQGAMRCAMKIDIQKAYDIVN